MYSRIAANKRKTILLIAGFVVFIGALGWLFGEVYRSSGLFVALVVFALVYAFVGYFASARIALAMNSAKLIERRDHQRYYRLVENMAITAGLPTPKVYLIDDPAPNAFATGRDPQHAAVAATTGLLDMLDDQELEGVLAHELSHIGNYDIRVMGIVLVLVTVVALVSDMFLRMSFFGRRSSNERGGGGLLLILGLVAALLAPLIAMLLRLAVSRRREYLADASGALLTRYPEGLASALEKIGAYRHPMRHASSATAHLFIANPLSDDHGEGGGLVRLFSTHPPIAERVKILRDMELGG
jgi:heat shock protein HtpX